MTRYGLLLDSGHLLSTDGWTTRGEAVEAMKRWMKTRRQRIEERSIVIPGRIVSLVKIKPHRADTIGSKGGHARAATLSPARRSEIAKRAARARWGKRRET